MDTLKFVKFSSLPFFSFLFLFFFVHFLLRLLFGCLHGRTLGHTIRVVCTHSCSLLQPTQFTRFTLLFILECLMVSWIPGSSGLRVVRSTPLCWWPTIFIVILTKVSWHLHKRNQRLPPMSLHNFTCRPMVGASIFNVEDPRLPTNHIRLNENLSQTLITYI